MLYQCDHMDCLHKFWIEIESFEEQIICPKCERKSGVILAFVVTVSNKDRVQKGLPNFIYDKVSEAIAWLKDEE